MRTIPVTLRMQVPAVLEVPRMELWFTLVLLQPIGQACGSASQPGNPRPGRVVC